MVKTKATKTVLFKPTSRSTSPSSKRNFNRSKSPSRSRRLNTRSSPNGIVRQLARVSISKERRLVFGRDVEAAISLEPNNSIPPLIGFSPMEISELKMAYYLDKEHLKKHLQSVQDKQKRAVDSAIWRLGGAIKLLNLRFKVYLCHMRVMWRMFCAGKPGLSQRDFIMPKQCIRTKGYVKKNVNTGMGARATSEVKLTVQRQEKRIDSGSQSSVTVAKGAQRKCQQKFTKSSSENAKLTVNSKSVGIPNKNAKLTINSINSKSVGIPNKNAKLTINSKSVGNPGGSAKLTINSKSVKNPGNNAILSSINKLVGNPGKNAKSSSTSKPVENPVGNAKSSSTSKSVENPVGNAESSTTSKSVENPGNNVKSSSTSKPVENPVGNAESSSTSKSVENPGNNVKSSSASKPVENPVGNAESSSTSKSVENPGENPKSSDTSKSVENPGENPKSSGTSKSVGNPGENPKSSGISKSDENPCDPASELKNPPCPTQSTLTRQYDTTEIRAAELNVPLQQENGTRQTFTLMAIEGTFEVTYELIGGEYQLVEFSRTPTRS